MDPNLEIITNEKISFFEWLFKLMVMALAGVSGWAFKMLWQSQNTNSDKLNKLELHISETYEKRETVQMSLSRIHDRLDELGTDIKTLIGQRRS